MPTPPEKYRDLVSAVSDGEAVDWDEVLLNSTGEEERRWLQGLRMIAEVSRAHAGSGEPEPLPVPAAGGVFRYEPIDRIGHGGMGDVWKAIDTQLKREVALKFLTADLAAHREFRERFLREARLAASLSHANLCVLFEVGILTEDLQLPGGDGVPRGTPFLAQELVAGRTLKQILLDQGPPSCRELLSIAVQIAEGLAAAHQKRIVHRDLKPTNVMRTPDGIVKVLDFGLARSVEPADPGRTDLSATAAATNLTRAGGVLGTVAYMSPEQAQGMPVDLRSDVFSLGVLLYELATGQRPFEADNTLATMARVLERDPPAPSSFRPDLPAGFDPVIARCLAKRPEDRFQDSGELLESLRKLEPESRRSARWARLARVARGIPGRRAVMGLLAIAAVVLALLVVPARTGGIVPRWLRGGSGAAGALPASGHAGLPWLDAFDAIPSIQGGTYKVLNPDPALWNPAGRSGFLTLWTHRGDSWIKQGELMPMRNLVGYPIDAAGFQATTCLDGFWPTEKYQQAGLIVLSDQDNYVRLALSPAGEGRRTPRALGVVIERRGEVLETDPRALPFPPPGDAGDPHMEERVWLRLSRDGDVWAARYSFNGIRYYLFGEWRVPLDVRHVALYAAHGITDEQGAPLHPQSIPAHFDFLRVEPYP